MKGIIKVIEMIVFLVLLVSVGILGLKVYNYSQEPLTHEVVYTGEVIEERISELSELVTLEYFYTNAETSGDSLELFNRDIPFTEKSLIVRYDGRIKYSTDLSGAKVKLNGNNIQVRIPHTQISSHEIDEESWEYVSEKNGLFNRLEPSDDSEIRKIAKATMEARADTLNLSEQADENAIKQITQLVKGIYPELNVEVIIQ